MGALLTPPTTLTWEDYATVMVSLEFHQLIRRVSWSALDTYLESVGVVCSCRASTGSHFTLTPACPRRSRSIRSRQGRVPPLTILCRVVATQKDSDQYYYRSNQEQQDQRATADTLEQPNIFRFGRHFRTPHWAGNEKAPADARASKPPILKRARSAGWEKFVALLRYCQATSAIKMPSLRRIFSESLSASLIISSRVRSTPFFHLQ